MNKTSRFAFGVALTCALVLMSCSDDGSAVVPPEEISKLFSPTVKPNDGKIGSRITILDAHFVATYSYLVYFRGADWALMANCDTGTTINALVPFGAVSGPISVSLGSDPFGVTPAFTVTEVTDTLTLSVRNYDITPPITAEDSSVVDYMGFRRTWTADISGDTVHLRRDFATGGMVFQCHFSLVNRGTNQLPFLTNAWIVSKPDYPGTRIDTIRTGLLKVQDWDTSGVMSGRFFGRPSTWGLSNGTIVFWIDRSR